MRKTSTHHLQVVIEKTLSFFWSTCNNYKCTLLEVGYTWSFLYFFCINVIEYDNENHIWHAFELEHVQKYPEHEQITQLHL